ncbi:hypothetical protein [Giesbergeria anulus]|nr:hypothetical protein [Giesbergeria anulus]
MLTLMPLEHKTLVRMLGGVMAEAMQMAAESAALSQLAVQGAQIARLAQRLNERHSRKQVEKRRG